MLVGDVMRRDVFTLRADELLSRSLREMLQRGIRHAPVMDGEKLVGLLSERNVLGHRARFKRDGKVREAMTEHPYVTDPEVSLASAAALMSTHKIGCLPVTAGAKLVGIVTSTDLLTAFAQEEVPAPDPGALSARHVMRPNVDVIYADDTLLDAAHHMLQRGTTHLAVVDGERRLVGILSEQDVRSELGDPRNWVEANELLTRMGTRRVGALMTRGPVTCGADAPLDEVAQLLADERLRMLPVVDAQGKVLGSLSYIDVLHAVIGRASASSLR